MRTRICDTFGIEYPIFAFTRSPQVVVAVSRAGGFGVLGAVASPPDELERDLAWIDAHIDGRPYGVDVVMPVSYAGSDPVELEKMIPEGHRHFVEELLKQHNVPPLPPGAPPPEGLLQWTHDRARKQVDISFGHPVQLIVNALGPPPEDIVREAHSHGVLVAALVGSRRHAEAQLAAGVDVIVAQGTEAGGHTGDVATMVLVPEVVAAVQPAPVLAAGGIGSGKQIAAALALGADGVWTGSIWLTVEETNTPGPVVQKLLSATSRDTVRSRSMTGKPARQLRTPWTEAWDSPESPGALPMPLQFMLTAEAQHRMHRYAGLEHSGAGELLGSPVGQIVGSMDKIRPAAGVFADLVREYDETVERMAQTKTVSRTSL